MLTVWLVRLPPQQARHSAADARQALFRNSGPSIAPYVPLGLTHRQAPVCARVASQALTPHLKRQPVSNALLLIFPTSQWPQCAGAVLQAHTARWRERQFAWTAWRARIQELTPVPASPVLLAVIPHQRPVCVPVVFQGHTLQLKRRLVSAVLQDHSRMIRTRRRVVAAQQARSPRKPGPFSAVTVPQARTGSLSASLSVVTASQASTPPKNKRQCVPTVLLDTLLASVQRSAHSVRQASTLPATVLILFLCVWIVPRTPILGQLGPRTRACVSRAQPANIHRKVQSPPVLASLVDFTPTVLLDATRWKYLNVTILRRTILL